MANNNLQQTANLLTAGIVAGPLFVVIALVQAFTREGFDIVQHPASLLSLAIWDGYKLQTLLLQAFYTSLQQLASRAPFVKYWQKVGTSPDRSLWSVAHYRRLFTADPG